MLITDEIKYSIGFFIWNGFAILQNIRYTYNGILFGNLKKQNTDTYYNTMNLKSIMLSKKAFTKHNILCDSICIKYPGWIFLQRWKADKWLPKARGETGDWLQKKKKKAPRSVFVM